MRIFLQSSQQVDVTCLKEMEKPAIAFLSKRGYDCHPIYPGKEPNHVLISASLVINNTVEDIPNHEEDLTKALRNFLTDQCSTGSGKTKETAGNLSHEEEYESDQAAIVRYTAWRSAAFYFCVAAVVIAFLVVMDRKNMRVEELTPQTPDSLTVEPK